MRDRLPNPVRRLVEAFASFTPGQKAVTVVGVVALGLGGFLFYSWASAPSYAPLFSNLSGTDASAIVEELAGSGTPYELTDGGATILVPQDKVYDLRIQMSGAGLPAEAETGYSLLDKQGITTSDFMQHVGYQRALEGELAKTIKSIDGVTAATVHLAIPQKDIFSDDEKRPTASVLVTSRAGKQLDQGQVEAIVHLVASSVEGLDPEQVTVAGANGAVLSAGGGQTMAAGGDARSQQTVEFEQRMNSALQRMVDSVVGPGNAVVTTTADLDFDKTETKTQTYVADPAVPPLSQSTTKETYNGAGTGSGGVLGPDNIQVPTGTGGNGQYESTTDTRNNAVGLVTETRESAPGNVRKLSVSVLLNSKVAEGVDMAQVERLVTSAVGLDTQRGDTVAVTTLPFDESSAEQAEQAAAEAQKAETLAQQISWAKTGGAVLAVVVLMFLAWRASRRAKKRSRLTPAELAHLEQAQAALDRNRVVALPGRDGDETAAIGSGPPALESGAVADRDAQQRSIAVMVQQQPEEVAQLLRGWLADRRG
jgi:flagellar M-ring protein FliF